MLSILSCSKIKKIDKVITHRFMIIYIMLTYRASYGQ